MVRTKADEERHERITSVEERNDMVQISRVLIMVCRCRRDVKRGCRPLSSRRAEPILRAGRRRDWSKLRSTLTLTKPNHQKPARPFTANHASAVLGATLLRASSNLAGTYVSVRFAPLPIVS